MQDMSKLLIKLRIKAFFKNPFKFIQREIQDFWYNIKSYIFPYNIIVCRDLPRSWCDRDTLMFHAVFQILVDFVELEQEFCDWQKRYKVKRYKDYPAMVEWVEQTYNTDVGRQSFYYKNITEEEKLKIDKSTQKRYLINKEILYLYKWYKDKKYDIDKFDVQEKTGQTIRFTKDGQLEYVDTGKEKLITQQEYHDLLDEHNIICDSMIRRCLDIRPYLWT